ncbi:DEKNAAC100908 [Brettanomyces naardenensis]|uniref:Large ribosomal subunit protein mL43 n=1 Tax=Brettanomyces naardenensis TaxID=13370 RepID=A0A448YFL8_BRENA|nr:DEKNAAC100908 [Brettanomyces naardenensis]
MVGINFIQQVSRARNGVGSFVLPCKKIVITYCNFGGSSQGMRDFLRLKMKNFATENPEVEFQVLSKPGFHPVIRGFYTNSQTKQICCRKWNADVIENKLKLLINSSGRQLVKPKQKVVSMNKSVRGIWSPFHVDPSQRYKI